MFALGLHYLNGWAMAAADGARKEQAEWPPHPDRVFMALAAAWFETGEDPAEGEALRWLETLPPPAIAASDADSRAAVVSYVPVNDASVKRKMPTSGDLNKLKNAGLALLPEYRLRQPRGFPLAIPHDPTVHLIWPEVELGVHRAALEQLAAKVTHVGHSASFVQAWFEEGCKITATWEPTEGVAKHRLRIPSTGRLDGLIRACNRAAWMEYHDLCAEIKQAEADLKAMKHPPRVPWESFADVILLAGEPQTKQHPAYAGAKTGDAVAAAKQGGSRSNSRRSPREQRQYIKEMKACLKDRFPNGEPTTLRPVPGRWQGYDQPPQDSDPKVPGSVFDPRLIVLGIKGKRVSLPATLKLTAALRGLLMRECREQPPPEWFSGHRRDGTPTAEPHLALTPLPFVGSEHADGRIMGLAIALPMGEAGHCLEPFLRDSTGLPREHPLFDGQWFECAIALETRERLPKNLDSDTWTRKSRIWASVTPVVLNQHFDGKDKWARAAESVKDMCGHIGLPRPREVLLHPVSLVEGVPHARAYPLLTRKSDGGRRSHNHAVIIFAEPVRGPVLVGAGRFRGYGLCRPMDERGEYRA